MPHDLKYTRFAGRLAFDWPDIRDTLALERVANMLARRIRRAAMPDDGQLWLALPEYDHIPQIVTFGSRVLDLNEATLEQYREYRDALKASLKRAGTKAKQHRETLAQVKRLERDVAQYFAGNDAMTIGLAIQLHHASLETPKVKRWSAGGKAKNRST